jgi:heparosan-N-sulfate-glucuronate 5-epimerase
MGFRRALAVAAAMAAVLSTPAAGHADTGAYLDIADWTPVEQLTVPGPDGIPLVRYQSGLEFNPTTISQWGLQHWSWYQLEHRQADLDVALRAADWLLAHQDTAGAWEYTFDFPLVAFPMRAPWISALAQGQAISLLVRAHHATGRQAYLDAALAALGPFAHTVHDGGVVDDWEGRPWYEEYPLPGALHVLNGFEFTLIGLHDLADVSPVAAGLFARGAVSLADRIGVFDMPAAHSQTYAALPPGRLPVGGVYRRAHAVLTRTLAAITGNAVLAAFAARWEGYLIWRPSPALRPVVGCRWRGVPVRHRGVSCRRARRVLAAYVRHGRMRSWRCRTASGRVLCRLGNRRVSATVLSRRLARHGGSQASGRSAAPADIARCD